VHPSDINVYVVIVILFDTNIQYILRTTKYFNTFFYDNMSWQICS